MVDRDNRYAPWFLGGLVTAIFSLVAYGLWGGAPMTNVLAVLVGCLAVITVCYTDAGGRFKPVQTNRFGPTTDLFLFCAGRLAAGILVGWATVFVVLFGWWVFQ